MNFMQIGVRPAVVGWFASYLYNRSQVTSFKGEQSDCKRIKGGIPQGSKLGPIAFIIKINPLPTSIYPITKIKYVRRPGCSDVY